MDQIAIILLGPLALWLSQDSRQQFRWWGCMLGILAQPFWFYAAWEAEQWGIFAIDFLYTAGWVRGFWKNRRAA